MSRELMLPEQKTDGAKMIVSKREILAAVSPSWLDANRFLAMAIIEANNLSDCYGPSLAKAALNCAVLGLLPGSAMGHAFFVPFKNKKAQGRKEAQIIVGYRGYLDLAFRSGFLSDAHPEVIVEGEDFDIWTDETGMRLSHKLTPRYRRESPQPARDNILGAYCVYHTKAGGRGIAGVTRAEIDAIDTKRNVWSSDFPAMCRKTAIRRAKNEWRTTIEFDHAAMLDDMEQRGEPQPSLVEEVEASSPEPVVSLADFAEEEGEQ